MFNTDWKIELLVECKDPSDLQFSPTPFPSGPCCPSPQVCSLWTGQWGRLSVSIRLSAVLTHVRGLFRIQLTVPALPSNLRRLLPLFDRRPKPFATANSCVSRSLRLHLAGHTLLPLSLGSASYSPLPGALSLCSSLSRSETPPGPVASSLTCLTAPGSSPSYWLSQFIIS